MWIVEPEKRTLYTVAAMTYTNFPHALKGLRQEIEMVVCTLHKTEPVTAGADATVGVRLFSKDLCYSN